MSKYIKYFKEFTISTGVNISLSYIVKFTLVIVSDFCLPFSINRIISEALTGPYITIKPVSVLISCAAIPGAPS